MLARRASLTAFAVVWLALAAHSASGGAAIKTAIRTYDYQASERDSKQDAREAAVLAAKRLFLDEIGTLIRTEYKEVLAERGGKISETVERRIQSVSAAVLNTKILKEAFNGQTYHVEVEFSYDEAEMLRRLQAKTPDSSSGTRTDLSPPDITASEGGVQNPKPPGTITLVFSNPPDAQLVIDRTAYSLAQRPTVHLKPGTHHLALHMADGNVIFIKLTVQAVDPEMEAATFGLGTEALLKDTHIRAVLQGSPASYSVKMRGRTGEREAFNYTLSLHEIS